MPGAPCARQSVLLHNLQREGVLVSQAIITVILHCDTFYHFSYTCTYNCWDKQRSTVIHHYGGDVIAHVHDCFVCNILFTFKWMRGQSAKLQYNACFLKAA